MKERYEVIKKLYPNYLILIRYKDKIKTFKEDKLIYNYLNKNIDKLHINYIILDNGYRIIYAFIIKKEYVRKNVTRLIYEVDVIQTFMFDFTI